MSSHEHHHHEHPHTHDTAGSEDRNFILLRYMYDHNEHHAEELADLIEALKTAGNAHAAELVAAALEEYQKGNELLHEALHHFAEA